MDCRNNEAIQARRLATPSEADQGNAHRRALDSPRLIGLRFEYRARLGDRLQQLAVGASARMELVATRPTRFARCFCSASQAFANQKQTGGAPERTRPAQ